MNHRHHNTSVIFTLEHECRLVITCDDGTLFFGLLLDQDLVLIVDVATIRAVVVSRTTLVKRCSDENMRGVGVRGLALAVGKRGSLVLKFRILCDIQDDFNLVFFAVDLKWFCWY